jgi:hypothetical protein
MVLWGFCRGRMRCIKTVVHYVLRTIRRVQRIIAIIEKMVTAGSELGLQKTYEEVYDGQGSFGMS